MYAETDEAIQALRILSKDEATKPLDGHITGMIARFSPQEKLNKSGLEQPALPSPSP